MKANPVEKFFPEEVVAGDTEAILDSVAKVGARNLDYDGNIGCNPGYIFRGEADWKVPLQSSIERHENIGLNADKLRKAEKEIIRQFIEGEGGKVAGIFFPDRKQLISDVRDDIFWWLSLMQHYGLPTRLIDFTRDVRMALYFAIEQAEKADDAYRTSKDLIIYCFPCRNPKHPDDPDNNKTPIAPPSRPDEAHIDMNRALGTLIGMEWMEAHKRNEKPAKQKFGWDRPYYQNPRLQSQCGMFVYPYDYPTESTANNHLSWFIQNLDCRDPFNWSSSAANPLPAKRIKIKGDVLELKRLLSKKFHLTRDTIYERGSKINLGS